MLSRMGERVEGVGEKVCFFYILIKFVYLQLISAEPRGGAERMIMSINQ